MSKHARVRQSQGLRVPSGGGQAREKKKEKQGSTCVKRKWDKNEPGRVTLAQASEEGAPLAWALADLGTASRRRARPRGTDHEARLEEARDFARALPRLVAVPQERCPSAQSPPEHEGTHSPPRNSQERAQSFQRAVPRDFTASF
jgi:hypothetical protein